MTDGTGTGPSGRSRSRAAIATKKRSRVERFAALVEETGTGRHHHRPADEDSDLLRLVRVAHQLGRVPAPRVREEFRDDLGQRLMVEFARHTAAQRASIPATRAAPETAPAWPAGPARRLAPDPDPARRASDEETQVVHQVRPRRAGRARLAVLIGLTTGTLALSGVSMASGDAVPGDPLYSVKRSGEQARLVLAGSDADRGRLHLDFARTRLIEAGLVTPEAVDGVLAEMDREVTEGARLLFSAAVQTGDATPLDAVVTFVAGQRAELLELRASVRAAGAPARQSLDLLDAVEIRANELRAALAEECTVMTIDRFGPRPAC